MRFVVIQYLSELEQIWNVYKIKRNSLVMTDETVRSLAQTNMQGAPKEIRNFLTQNDSSIDDLLRTIETAKEENENYAILSMWAIFEQCVQEYIECSTRFMAYSALTNSSLEMTMGVKELETYIIGKSERWTLNEKLQVALIPLIGGEKTKRLELIKKYRDWVAHRSSKKETPSKTQPNEAYLQLSTTIEALEKSMQSRMVFML
jgi:hypothetical protein